MFIRRVVALVGAEYDAPLTNGTTSSGEHVLIDSVDRRIATSNLDRLAVDNKQRGAIGVPTQGRRLEPLINSAMSTLMNGWRFNFSGALGQRVLTIQPIRPCTMSIGVSSGYEWRHKSSEGAG